MAGHATPVGPVPPGADPDVYDRMRRRVLWKLPMGLYVLGSAAGERRNLMTINWAMQVSTQPKHVAVSIERAALTHRLVSEGGCFSLSLLSREDRAEARKFVKPSVQDASAGTLNQMAYRTARSGAPVPAIAVAWLDCEVRQAVPVGSHTLFVGEVVDAGFAEAGEEVPVLRMEDTRMSYGG